MSDGYAPGQDRPLRGYLATLGGYLGACATLVGLARLTGHRPPERPTAQDVLMMSVATHKVSRLLTKDSVTSPLRAPFARYERATGHAEVGERARGTGFAHAVGELVTCPFCLGVWVATGLSAGLVFAPRLTRMVAATFTAVAVSDMLQLAYATLQQRQRTA
jgi:Protein of unknown function (DUF1360)